MVTRERFECVGAVVKCMVRAEATEGRQPPKHLRGRISSPSTGDMGRPCRPRAAGAHRAGQDTAGAARDSWDGARRMGMRMMVFP